MSGIADGGQGKISTWGAEWVFTKELVGRCELWKIVDMRKIVLWALILGMATVPFSNAAAQEESESAKVRALEVRLMESYKERQIDLLASLLDDDFVITFEDGSIYGKTGYISYSATPSVRVDVAEMSDVKIRMHGDTAILTGAYHERGDNKGKAYDYRDRFTDVWMKTGGKWRLVASHYGVPVKP
jgi:ketosteroid isomerase-like protein